MESNNLIEENGLGSVSLFQGELKQKVIDGPHQEFIERCNWSNNK